MKSKERKLFITRAEGDYSTSPSRPIERDEWTAFAKTESDLRVKETFEAGEKSFPAKGLVEWTGHSSGTPILMSCSPHGFIWINNPDDETRKRAGEIAKALHARVQEEEFNPENK